MRQESDPALIRLTGAWDGALNAVLFINRLKIMLRPGARILDVGCGDGRIVFRLRELGFEAYGFDIHDYVAYRSEADRQWFRFAQSTSDDTSAFTVDADQYAIPFEDDFFDVVHSTSVLEHVLDVRPVFRECARVLSPDGIAVHFYPGKWQLMEPHLYVPLASFVQWKAWLRLWIALGARNEFQAGRTAAQVADAYRTYAMTGLRYRTTDELRSAALPYFDHVFSPPKAITRPGASVWTQLRRVRRAFAGPDVYKQLALCGQPSSLVCDRKKTGAPARFRSALWKAA
jgi:SAM-dependent methyltransferase